MFPFDRLAQKKRNKLDFTQRSLHDKSDMHNSDIHIQLKSNVYKNCVNIFHCFIKVLEYTTVKHTIYNLAGTGPKSLKRDSIDTAFNKLPLTFNLPAINNF